MRRRTSHIILLLILAAALVFTGCGESQNAPTNKPEADSTSEETQAKDTLTIGIGSDVSSLDVRHSTAMLELRLYENLYDTLVVFREGEIQPSLAKSWDISADGREYTFTLEEGVTFHNGEPFTSEDVKDTIESWDGTPNMYDLTEMIEGVEVVDEYTVKVTLKTPSALFLINMSAMGSMYCSKNLAEYGDDYAQNPIGTGPYKFVEHQTGISVTFEAHEDYFKGTPAIKEVLFKIIPDSNTLVTALETHDIDFVYAIPVASAPIFDGNDEITIAPLEGIRINWVTMNNETAPFDNKQVRQAVNYAINRDFMNDMLDDGLGFPLDIMASKGMFGKPETYKGYSYNVEKAKTLMAEAGYADGITLEQGILATAFSAQSAQIIQQSLSDIGITVDIEQVEFGTYIDNLYSGNFQVAVSGYYMILPDVDACLQMYKSTNIDSMNTARYSNPEADALMEAAILTSDADERIEIYNQLYEILQDDSPYAIYSNSVEIVAYDSGLNINNLNAKNSLIYDMSWQ